MSALVTDRLSENHIGRQNRETHTHKKPVRLLNNLRVRVSTWSAAASSALSMSMRIKARAKILRECQTATAQASSQARIVSRPEEEASPSLYDVFSILSEAYALYRTSDSI